MGKRKVFFERLSKDGNIRLSGGLNATRVSRPAHRKAGRSKIGVGEV